MSRTHRKLRRRRLILAALAGLGAAPGLAGAAGAPAHCRPDCAPPATARASDALIVLPRGIFLGDTLRWTRSTIRTDYAGALRQGGPIAHLTPWRSRTWTPVAPIPGLGTLPAGPARLEHLADSLGRRLVRRLRLEIDRDSEAADPEDPVALYAKRKLRRELAIEACGLLAGTLAPAVADGDLSAGDLAGLVAGARGVGRDYARSAGTRSSYSEAAYLALTVAGYADGLVDVANDPGAYVDSRLGSRDAGRRLRDALVGAACRAALGQAGLSRVRVATGGAGRIGYTMSVFAPATPPMAVRDGLVCGPPEPPFGAFRRCTWSGPFAGRT